MKLRLQDIKHSVVVKNVLSVGLIQAANYLIPIVVIPFVVRALGTEYFGKASYAQNITAYLTILVNYGFEYSATQEIAINKENKDKLKSLFWSVMRFKGLLLAISFVILFLLYITGGRVHEDPLLYMYAALTNIGVVLFPTWFFQGMEEMHKMAITNVAIKLLGALLVIGLVTAPSDYRLYLLFLSVSYILAGAVSFVYVVHHFKLGYISKAKEKNVITQGFPVFLNTVFATLYSVGGITILGFFASDTEIGLYAGAHKIAMAVVLVTSTPMTMALFPNMSRKFKESKAEGRKHFERCLLLTGIASLAVSIVSFFAAPYAIRILLGEKFLASEDVFRLLSPLPFLITMASMFTIQGLYGLQLYKYAPYIGVTVGVFSTVCNLALIPRYGMYGTAISYLLSELLEIVLSGYVTVSHITRLTTDNRHAK